MPAELAVVAKFSAISDEEIVARVLEGETPLFEVLMRRHNERVYRAARAIIRNDHEAEDVMQEAYVNAYAHLGQFDGRAKFSTWLTKIAVYEALARARRQGLYEPLDDHSLETFMPPTSSPDPEQQVLGVSEDVVKTRFSRARHALQQDLLDRTGAAAGSVFTFGQARCDHVVEAVL